MRNGENYPQNYREYLEAVVNNETPRVLPAPETDCHNCGRSFSDGRSRNKHVRSRTCFE